MTNDMYADARSERIADLRTHDSEFRAAAPVPDVLNAARRPGLRLTEALGALMDGYADRPALGSRAVSLLRDPASGRNEHQLLPVFETVTYGELWSDAKAISAAWSTGPTALKPGEFVATIGFASADYVRVDLACVYLGLVSVPLQHNAAASQLTLIFAEALPRVLAVSASYLGLAVELAVESGSLERIVVFDYDEHLEDHREALQESRVRLSGRPVTVELLPEVVARGRALAVPSPFVAGDDERLAMILYTSGSTGAPKGAMWTERMVTTLWTTEFFSDQAGNPAFLVNFMPLNHIGGRIALSVAFQAGGVHYFVPKPDLSTLFEDWSLTRPTLLPLVPRVVDMLYQRYQTRVDHLIADGHDAATAGDIAKTELREQQLGGRVLGGLISTAPLAPEMRTFLESCVQAHIFDGYGTTEVGVVSRDGIITRPPVTDYKLVDVPELGYFATDRPYPRGELLVKTATATPGYYRRPEVTADVFDVDGYYRTGDVMAEIESDHLVYVDRRNNVLKLSQGEFVAVANLEAIYAGAPLVRQIYVYGNSERSVLLAVVVPTQEALSRYPDHTELKTALLETLRSTARTAELQPYEIPADLLIETQPFTQADGLLSGVGKLLRPKLKERYGEDLERRYAQLADRRSDELRKLRDAAGAQPTVDTVTRAAQALLGLPGTPPTADAHFTDLGGDSLSALSFSNLLGETFGVEAPVGVIINPAADLAAIARYIENERAESGRRATATTVHGPGATSVAAGELTLDKFLDQATLQAAPSARPASPEVHTVLLTGSNGYLGRFLALEWLQRLSQTGGRLIVLLRGDDAESARRRLEQAFDTGDAGLLREFHELADKHLDVVVGDVAEPRFGLDEATWQHLARDVDLIVHPAALVNHVLPYSQLFGPNVVGTAEVIRLAISERIKPVTYLSTVVVAMGVPDFREDGDIREVSAKRSIDDGYANGYANSKWAGEVLLREAHDVCGLPVSVFRADLILAHRRYTGQLNVPDAFTRLIVSLLLTGIAPESFYVPDGSGKRPRAHYDGLPADFVAEAITTIGAQNLEGFSSYDVMNPHDDGVSLDVFVDWLIAGGAPITRMSDHAEWVSRFEGALRALPEKQRQRSALALLDAMRVPEQPLRGAVAPTDVFRKAVKANKIGTTQDIPQIDSALIRKTVADIERLGLI